MILEIGIGDSVAVRLDDAIEDTRLNPEQCEDYLTRMVRTAVSIYRQLPDAEGAPVSSDDAKDEPA